MTQSTSHSGTLSITVRHAVRTAVALAFVLLLAGCAAAVPSGSTNANGAGASGGSNSSGNGPAPAAHTAVPDPWTCGEDGAGSCIGQRDPMTCGTSGTASCVGQFPIDAMDCGASGTDSCFTATTDPNQASTSSLISGLTATYSAASDGYTAFHFSYSGDTPASVNGNVCFQDNGKIYEATITYGRTQASVFSTTINPGGTLTANVGYVPVYPPAVAVGSSLPSGDFYYVGDCTDSSTAEFMATVNAGP